MTCHIFSLHVVSALCSKCSHEAAPVHFVGEKAMFCARCCPVHGEQPEPEWAADPLTIAGKQEELF